MKNIILLSLFLLTFSLSFGQASNVSQEMLNTEGATELILDLGTADITIKSTKGSRIIIESLITIATPNEKMLSYLISAGRYKLEVSHDPTLGTLTITPKGNLNVLLVKGEECTETFSYTVFVPETMNMTSTDTTVVYN